MYKRHFVTNGYIETRKHTLIWYENNIKEDGMWVGVEREGHSHDTKTKHNFKQQTVGREEGREGGGEEGREGGTGRVGREEREEAREGGGEGEEGGREGRVEREEAGGGEEGVGHRISFSTSFQWTN